MELHPLGHMSRTMNAIWGFEFTQQLTRWLIVVSGENLHLQFTLPWRKPCDSKIAYTSSKRLEIIGSQIKYLNEKRRKFSSSLKPSSSPLFLNTWRNRNACICPIFSRNRGTTKDTTSREVGVLTKLN